MKRIILVLLLVYALSASVNAQCCGGGSGSPIAGGESRGVLMERQMEISSSFVYLNTDKFLTGNTPDTNFLDNYNSKYEYTRLAYGLSKKFTLSIESGYWINKTQIGLHGVDTNDASGFGDLIISPRYNVYNKTKNSWFTELTLGIGFKIPLGKYNDSLRRIEPFSGEVYYIPKTLAVQPSSGAQDIIFQLFFFHGHNIKKLNFIANMLYIKKGWNPLGEKIGDYAGVTFTVSKTYFKRLGLALQLKGEWVDQMSLNKNILLYAYPNYDPFATGYRKVMLAPIASYFIKQGLSVFVMPEIPVYQYMFKTQIASKFQVNFGITYRFFPFKMAPAVE